METKHPTWLSHKAALIANWDLQSMTLMIGGAPVITMTTSDLKEYGLTIVESGKQK